MENVLLSVSEILGVFVIALTAANKYSLRNRKKLPHSIQVQLSKKQKQNSHFLAPYRKSTSTTEHFQKKKYDPHRLSIFEIKDYRRCGYLNF